MASLKAADHGNAYAERLAWEGGNRFANSIRSFLETAQSHGLNPSPRMANVELRPAPCADPGPAGRRTPPSGARAPAPPSSRDAQCRRILRTSDDPTPGQSTGGRGPTVATARQTPRPRACATRASADPPGVLLPRSQCSPTTDRGDGA